MPRLFIGTFLSQQDQQRLSVLPKQNEHLQSQWERRTRWVKPSKLHITWLFLGEVDEELVPKVGAALHRTLYERRTMQQESDKGDVIVEFNQPEVWPNSRKARLIVVASKPVAKNVEALARRIRTNLIPFYSEETELEHNQEFKPHVTLMRLDRRVDRPGDRHAMHRIEASVNPKKIDALENLLPIRLTVEQVCLIESNVAGDEYRILDIAKLADSES
ncbi:MAG TPA: 2'-5' RNA ligase family protein [Drouetiella sp.]